MQNYRLFLDYLELRRRIEKRLAHPNLLLAHAAVFSVAVTYFSIYVTQQMMRFSYDPNIRFAFYPPETFVVTGWAVLLMIHGLRTYLHSGAAGGTREQAVADEIGERIEKDDSHLTSNHRDLFRLHGLLERDIQQRSSGTALLMLFTVCNGLGWLLWAFTNVMGMSGENAIEYPWQAAPILSLVFLIVLVANQLRLMGHNAVIKDQVAAFNVDEYDEVEKEKSDYRLALDDELIDFEPATLNGKRKRG
jgi:hypothetical protein